VAFVSRQDAANFAQVVLSLYNQHKDDPVKVKPVKEGKKGKRTKANEAKTFNLPFQTKDVQDEYRKQFGEKLPHDAIAVSLFGRMVADMTDMSVESAVWVSPSISTHSIAPETEFISAVDEPARNLYPTSGLRPKEHRGAGIIIDQQFHPSHVILDTVGIDVDLWLSRMTKKDGSQFTVEEKRKLVRAAMITAIAVFRSAKQHSNFSNEETDFVLAYVCDGQPVSLAAAFEKDVKAANGKSLLTASKEALMYRWNKVLRNHQEQEFDSLRLRKIVVANGDGKPQEKTECVFDLSTVEEYSIQRLLNEISSALF
jgi:hypothetical protein